MRDPNVQGSSIKDKRPEPVTNVRDPNVQGSSIKDKCPEPVTNVRDPNVHTPRAASGCAPQGNG